VRAKGYCSPVEKDEFFCAINELRKLGDLEEKLIEERYNDVVKQRGINSGHEVLQILANTLEV
jgi:hypothetical protein